MPPTILDAYKELLQREETERREYGALQQETWLFLNREEPDPNRRASLWLIARRWVQAEYKEGSLEGARALEQFIRGMLARGPQTG